MRAAHLVLLVSCCLVLPALSCSPAGDGTLPTADGGGWDATSPGDGGVACVSRDFEPTPLEPDDTLVDVAPSKDGAFLLLQGKDGVLAVQEVGGDRHVLEATGSTGAAIAGRPDGTVCVVWGVGARGAATVKSACSPSFEVGDTGITLAMAKRYPVAFRDEGPAGAAVLFAETNSLDGLSRDGLGVWRDANVMESSISFAGGPRALSGATEGSPLCFVSQGNVVVERWGLSGSANAIGTIRPESSTMFYEDVGCAVATQGETVGVLAVGKGKARLAVREAGFGAKLVETPLEAEGITAWSFGATRTHFVAVYATGGSLFRASRAVEGTIEVTPVALPGGARVAGKVALAWGVGVEHLAVASEGHVLVARTCTTP